MATREALERMATRKSLKDSGMSSREANKEMRRLAKLEHKYGVEALKLAAPIDIDEYTAASKKKKPVKALAGLAAEDIALLLSLGVIGYGAKKTLQYGKKAVKAYKKQKQAKKTKKATRKAAAEEQLEYIKKHGARGATAAHKEASIATKFITTTEGEPLRQIMHSRTGQRIGKPRPPEGVEWRKSKPKAKAKAKEQELNRLLKVEQGFKKIIKRLESKGQDTATAKKNLKKTEDALAKLIEEMTK